VSALEQPPIGVLVADDHGVVRRAIRLLLEAQDDIEVVGEAADVASTVAAARALRPDVALCDLMMPDGSILTELQSVLDAGSAVVVLTMTSDPAFAREALRGGASAYVLKDAAPDEIVAAVRAARPLAPA